MMRYILLVVSLLVVAVHSQDVSGSNDLWDQYKVAYRKEYASEREDIERKKIFFNNLAFVMEHNEKFERGEVTFDVEINKFADMSSSEFAAMMNGLKVPANWVPSGDVFQEPEGLVLPPTVDWRKKGAVTPVKDQGQCGSCWAFSATGSLEGQTFVKTKKLVSLSEQNLVDCSGKEGNQGCNGGLMDQAFKYVKINRGIDTEKTYPYEAKDDRCRYNPKNKGTTDRSYVDIPAGSESKLQVAVAIKGPISVAIDASQPSFQMYKSGVYSDPECSTEDLDHGVLAVGYGNVTKGGAYWLVKNSWGTSWGMQGYIMMARNKRNMCGIASMASFPTV